jgi:hypothetical protein
MLDSAPRDHDHAQTGTLPSVMGQRWPECPQWWPSLQMPASEADTHTTAWGIAPVVAWASVMARELAGTALSADACTRGCASHD